LCFSALQKNADTVQKPVGKCWGGSRHYTPGREVEGGGSIKKHQDHGDSKVRPLDTSLHARGERKEEKSFGQGKKKEMAKRKETGGHEFIGAPSKGTPLKRKKKRTASRRRQNPQARRKQKKGCTFLPWEKDQWGGKDGLTKKEKTKGRANLGGGDRARLGSRGGQRGGGSLRNQKKKKVLSTKAR